MKGLVSPLEPFLLERVLLHNSGASIPAAASRTRNCPLHCGGGGGGGGGGASMHRRTAGGAVDGQAGSREP